FSDHHFLYFFFSSTHPPPRSTLFPYTTLFRSEITEGVLRIQYLMSALDPDAWQLDELATLRQHHEATAGMPILDAYKALPKKEQFRLDRERWTLEERHKPAVQRELQWLVSYRFPGVTLLQ